MRLRRRKQERVLDRLWGGRAIRETRDQLDRAFLALERDELPMWDAAWHEIERIARAQPSRRPG